MGSKFGVGTWRSHGTWEPDVHVIVKQKGVDSPAHEAKSEKIGSKTRVLHRNLLLPCNYLPTDNSQQTRKRLTTVIPRQTRQQPPKPVVHHDNEVSSDQEFSEVVILPQSPPVNPPVPSEHPQPPVVEELLNTPSTEAIASEDPANTDVAGNIVTESPIQLEGPIEEQPNAIHANPNTTEIYNLRPQRNRHQPNRLTYYNPGDPVGVFPIST